jgi:hypothetical protein
VQSKEARRKWRGWTSSRVQSWSCGAKLPQAPVALNPLDYGLSGRISLKNSALYPSLLLESTLHTTMPPLLLLLPVLLLFATAHGYPSTCSNATCGHLTIAYPFWLNSSSASSCGYPGLGLACEDNTTLILLAQSHDRYIVSDIDFATHTIFLADGEAFNATAPPPQPHHRHGLPAAAHALGLQHHLLLQLQHDLLLQLQQEMAPILEQYRISSKANQMYQRETNHL